MPKYDLRILLETVGGAKSSYITQSFVNTDKVLASGQTELVLSASQVYNRITGSVSCSYQNNTFFSQSSTSGSYVPGGDFNSSFTFKDNTLLSASLTGSLNTGSVVFTSTNNDYDRLLKYKFIGEKVCNVLGLPSSQWIYVDQVRLPVDDESNFIEGNIRSENIFVGDQITFANNSTINSDLTVQIDTGSDRHIKFIDTTGIPRTPVIFGYDADANLYELTSEDTDTFDITIGTGSIKILSGSIDVDGDITAHNYIVSSSVTNIITQNLSGSTIFGDTPDDTHEVTGSMDISGSLEVISGSISSSAQIYSDTGFKVGSNGSITASIHCINIPSGHRIYGDDSDNLYIQSVGRFTTETPAEVNINSDSHITLDSEKTIELQGATGITLSAPVTASSTISSSGAITGSGISSSGQVYVGSTLHAPNIGTGVDNSIVILDSDGLLKTDEVVGTNIWSAQNFISDGGGDLTNNKIPFVSDGSGFLLDNSNITNNTTNKGITVVGAITASGDISSSGTIYASNFESVGASGETINFNDNLVIVGNISSSGDISSSLNSKLSMGSGSFVGPVGIGTSVPKTPLHIKSVGESDGGLRFENTHDTVNMFFVGDDNDEGFQITYVGTGGAEIELKADGDLLLNASNGDNVAIGNSSPGAKLDITGDLRTSTNITASGNISSSGDLILNTGTGSFDYITTTNDISSSGDIIGTTGSFGEINLEDDKRIKLGTGDDLQIYHNGDNSVISDLGAGDLLINGANVRIRDANDGNTIALFTQGAGVELRHDNTVRFETSDGGINVTGQITASGNISSSLDSNLTIGGIANVNQVSASNGIVVDNNISASGNLEIAGIINGTQVSASNGIIVDNNISASGDITALGTIQAEQITSTDDMLVNDDLTVEGQINAAADIVHTLDADTKISFAVDKITLAAGGVDMITLTEDTNDTIEFGAPITSNITASGNISSSGTIFANDYGGNVSGSLTSTGSFGKIEVKGTGSFDGGAIFGGDISSSAKITSKELLVQATANNVTPFVIRNVDAQKQMDLSIDSNQHSELGIFKDGGEKIKFNSYWPAVIDNDFYETAGGIILGTDIGQASNRYGIFVSGGPDSGSAYFDENIKLGDAGTIATSSIHIANAQGDVDAAFRGSMLTLTPNSLINDDGFTGITMETSTNVNGYGISMGARRYTTDGKPAFVLHTHNNNLAGTERFRIQQDGLISFVGNITASGNISGSLTSNLTIGGIANVNQVSASNGIVVDNNISASGNLEIAGIINGTQVSASNGIIVDSNISGSGNLEMAGSITATSADINGAVDIDGGNLTVGTALQLTNGGVFNFGSSLADGTLTWGNYYASLYGQADNKLRLGSFNQQGVLTISSSTENVMVISASNVGIGTNTPGEKLEVIGNISSSGTITGNDYGGNISGSLTSTGSFGSLIVPDKVQGNLTIDGILFATRKSFLINTPTGGKLEYGALEGQQNDVFFRGELKGDNVIYLPQEWEWLVDENTITVKLTSIGKHQDLYIKEIKDNKIFIGINGIFNTKENIHCYHIVHATRKDVELIRNLQ